MRWTSYTKEKAIEMISAGISEDEIAKTFRMSKSSVILLKYSVVNVNLETLKCEVCGEYLKQITSTHLKNHNMSLDEYEIKYPDSKTITESRSQKYKSFKHPNKGKTYCEIYGEKEANIKKNKISKKQIGREAPFLAGTGITGTRKDTGIFARSSYEANVDRIFAIENKKICGEFSEENKRFILTKNNGEKITYQPDRIDSEGLFSKGAFLEIKGYMYPEDWEKICLFREQNPQLKLLVISKDEKYYDIDYKELERKYRNRIQLWEDQYQNYKKNPEIYQIDYIEPSEARFFRENYLDFVSVSVKEEHLRFIAKKCVSYCSVRFGKKTYVDNIRLVFITDRRPKSRISTGKYFYEMWEISTHDNKKYYITNQEKTTLFYCYEENRFLELSKFFENNNNAELKYGPKSDLVFLNINKDLVDKFERKDILKRIEDIFSHRAIPYSVEDIKLVYKEETKRGAINNREEWEIIVDKKDTTFKLTNFGNATAEYNLIEIIKDS